MSHTFKDRKDIINPGDPITLKLESFFSLKSKDIREGKLITDKVKRSSANVFLLSLRDSFLMTKR